MVRKEYINLCVKTLCIAAIGYFLFTYVLLIRHVEGMEMFPSVKDGDLVLAYRLAGEFEDDDIVFYRIDGEEKIGRIIARENDVVMLDQSGTLLVNGTVQSEEVVFSTYAKEGMEYPFRVPEGSIFVLGDYRTQSVDSRDFGAIPISEVEGKVISLLRRRGL